MQCKLKQCEGNAIFVKKLSFSLRILHCLWIAFTSCIFKENSQLEKPKNFAFPPLKKFLLGFLSMSFLQLSKCLFSPLSFIWNLAPQITHPVTTVLNFYSDAWNNLLTTFWLISVRRSSYMYILSGVRVLDFNGCLN